jgi:hypothetical protein
MRCFAAQRIASAARSTPPRHFEEAFALIKKAWTVPGPFRWEGKHYHLHVDRRGRPSGSRRSDHSNTATASELQVRPVG